MQIIEYLVQQQPPPRSNHFATQYYNDYKSAENERGVLKYISLSFCWFFITFKTPTRKLFAQYFSSLYNNEENPMLKKIWRSYHRCYATKWKIKKEEEMGETFENWKVSKKIENELFQKCRLPIEIQTIVFDYYYSFFWHKLYFPLIRQISEMVISRYIYRGRIENEITSVTILYLSKDFKVFKRYRLF